MSRPAQAIIDLAALRHNVQKVRTHAPAAKLMAVVKANAYGHGAVTVAQTLAASVDAFAVCSLEEALILREQNIQKPLILLEGFFYPDELPQIAHHQFEIVVHNSLQVAQLLKAPLKTPINIWLKVDTGMHRLGFPPEEIESLYKLLKNQTNCIKKIRLMSHLACADDLQDPTTAIQTTIFQQVTRTLPVETSLANSAGLLGWPQTHADWVRPGIMLYGISPFLKRLGREDDLQPVMELQSILISVKHQRAGDAIGYGGSWHCPAAMPVGMVAIGYADGYPRHAPTGTPVLINGQRAPLIGRISMDMLAVDLRNHPQAQIGDAVTLWGKELPIEEIANLAGTIAYQLLCNVNPRVRRVERE